MGLEKGANGLIVSQRISPEIHPIIPKNHPISHNNFFNDKFYLKLLIKFTQLTPLP